MDETLCNDHNIHGEKDKKELEQDLRVLKENVRVLDATGDMLSGIVDLEQNEYVLRNKS